MLYLEISGVIFLIGSFSEIAASIAGLMVGIVISNLLISVSIGNRNTSIEVFALTLGISLFVGMYGNTGPVLNNMEFTVLAIVVALPAVPPALVISNVSGMKHTPVRIALHSVTTIVILMLFLVAYSLLYYTGYENLVLVSVGIFFLSYMIYSLTWKPLDDHEDDAA